MKKAPLCILAVLLALAVLAACSSNNGNGSSSGNSGASSSGSTGSDNAAASEKTTPTKAELRIALQLPQFESQFRAFYDKFKAKMLEEENIDVDIIPDFIPSENATQVLQTRLISSTPPDVFSFHAYIETDLYKRAGYLEDLSGQPFIDHLNDDVRDIMFEIGDGQMLSVPLDLIYWGYLYNVDIFDKYSLKAPQTITELRQAIDTLKSNNVTPFSLAYGETHPAQSLMIAAMAPYLSNLPDFYDRMSAGEGSFTEVIDMFEVIDLVNSSGNDRMFEYGVNEIMPVFAGGDTAMWVMGPWYAAPLQQTNPDFNFRVAPFPVSDNPEDTALIMGLGQSFGVNTKSKNKELALKFINFVLDEKESSGLYESIGTYPLAKVHNYETGIWYKDLAQYTGNGQVVRDLDIPRAVRNEGGSMMQGYAAGSVTKEDLLGAMDRAWADFNRTTQ